MTALRDRLAANDAMPSLAGYRALAEDAIREAEATPADSLDALLLARAMHAAQRWCDGTESDTWRTDTHAEDDAVAWTVHGEDAKQVAAEYDRLRGGSDDATGGTE